MFTWSVEIDGTDVAVLVPRRGRSSAGARHRWTSPPCPWPFSSWSRSPAPTWPTCGRSSPWAGRWGRPDSPSTYADAVRRPSSRLLLNAPVTVATTTPSGFTDTYADTYAGTTLTRFTGRIQAIDYTPTRSA